MPSSVIFRIPALKRFPCRSVSACNRRKINCCFLSAVYPARSSSRAMSRSSTTVFVSRSAILILIAHAGREPVTGRSWRDVTPGGATPGLLSERDGYCMLDVALRRRARRERRVAHSGDWCGASEDQRGTQGAARGGQSVVAV